MYWSYRIDVHNAIDYSLLFDGRAIPTSGYLTINTTGEYRFTVSASNGVVTEVKKYKILVVPRPLTTRLHVDGVPRAFSTVNPTVRVVDMLTGAAVKEVGCSLRLSEATLTVAPWTPVRVTLTPVNLSRNTVPVEVMCGDGLYYERETYMDSIYVYATTAVPDVEFLGEGTISVRLLAPDNRTEATGEVSVYLNERYVGRITLPALITGIPVGNSTIRLHYVPNV